MEPVSKNEQLLAVKRSYQEKPFLRRARTCEAILGGAATVMFIVLFVVVRLAKRVEDEGFRAVLVGIGIVALVGFLGAVLFVCFLALTGPIYKNQLDFARGELQTWGVADKVAAVVISVLIIGAAVFFVQRFIL